MNEITPPKKKTVSYSQFSNYWSCSYRFFRDYILKEKTFEDSLNMSFGTGIHEAIQLYLKTLYHKTEKQAESIDLLKYFTWAFKREVTKKKIPHTPEELNEFIEDGRCILSEFKDSSNRLRYFPRDKWELLGIEDKLNMELRNNIMIVGYLDLVLKEKISGNIRIVDFKTSTRGWSYEKEDFTKNAQLKLYKALYSKQHNIPLSKIHVEFVILKRKIYADYKYEQTRIQIHKPPTFQSDILEVIKEFNKFIDVVFTPNGEYNMNAKYHKIPGKGNKNCKYCNYAKNGKCDKKADPIE